MQPSAAFAWSGWHVAAGWLEGRLECAAQEVRLSAPTGRYILGPWGPPVHRRGPQVIRRLRLVGRCYGTARLAPVGPDGGTRGGCLVGCSRVVACFRGLRMGRARRGILPNCGTGYGCGRLAGRRYGNWARLLRRARCARGIPQVTACPTAREGAGVGSALTCKKSLFRPDLTIWHPVPSIAHPVRESRAGSSQSPSAHAVRTVITVTGSD